MSNRIYRMQYSKQRGGTRQGAGRPELADEYKKRNHTVRTTDTQWDTFIGLGGNRWLCELLDSLKGNKAKAKREPKAFHGKF